MYDGKKIKIGRIKANLKAIDLSKQLGISNVKMSLIENNRVDVPEEIYKKIASILKI